jgi:XTP/dITP diphosphohydrolase
VKLLLATNNPHKRREIEALLGPLGVEIVAPGDVGGIPEVEEDRNTFAGNAAKKAASAARATGLWALADDSGLAVDHLGGAPGVLSARYAGSHGDDEANNDKLLRELDGVPEAERGAKFIAALALADPAGEVALEVRGETQGVIQSARTGHNGFGYDPLFRFAEAGYPQEGKTFAEIPQEEKSTVSHRGRALRLLAERLPAMLDSEA